MGSSDVHGRWSQRSPEALDGIATWIAHSPQRTPVDSPTPAQCPSPRTPWDGDLTFAVECRLRRDADRGKKHPVTIHDDWWVTTPHEDMDTLRVAYALGDYCSCVELVDRVVPALRSHIEVATRSRLPRIRAEHPNLWRVVESSLAPCCREKHFGSASSAMQHLLTTQHLTASINAPRWLVNTVMRNIPDSLPSAFTSVAREGASLVAEDDGCAQLWDAGLHPRRVAEMAALAPTEVWPLPVSYYLGLAYASNAASWIGKVLPHRATASVAKWLAWQTVDVSGEDAARLSEWFDWGIRMDDWKFVAEHRLDPDHVRAVAAATGWAESSSATKVLEWAKVGCAPSPEQFAMLMCHGYEFDRPGSGALAVAVSEAERLKVRLDRTELGLMLVLANNWRFLVVAVREGARTPEDIVDFWDRKRSA